MHKIGQSGGFLGTLLGPLRKTGLHLMKHVLKQLAKSVLMVLPLGLTAAASATDVAICKKMFGSGRHSDLVSRTTKLIISEEEMNDIMNIVKSLEESGLLINNVSKSIRNEAKEQEGGFLSMLLDILGASLLGNLLTDDGTTRAGEDTIRAGQDF